MWVLLGGDVSAVSNSMLSDNGTLGVPSVAVLLAIDPGFPVVGYTVLDDAVFAMEGVLAVLFVDADGPTFVDVELDDEVTFLAIGLGVGGEDGGATVGAAVSGFTKRILIEDPASFLVEATELVRLANDL